MFKEEKRIIRLLISLIVVANSVNPVFSQNKAKQHIASFVTGITFTDGKWKDVKAKARKDNKYIFVDAFTTWCAPCRQLKKVTFKERNAVAYFNSNFINYTVDMEKGEGIELAEQWGVTGYPALLFFTPEGKMIMKHIGYVDGKQFVEFGKQALDRK